MTFIPMDITHLQVQLQNDVQQLRSMIAWAEQRSYAYTQELTTGVMTAASISSPDQTAILAFIADLNRLYAYMTGTIQSVASDMRFDCAAVLGVS